MRARTCAAAAVLALSAVVLAGCHTNVGTAATVNGHRISESDVSSYVSHAGPKPQLLPGASGQTLPAARTFVLQILIAERLFDRAVEANGGPASAADLAKIHDAAVQGALQAPGSGAVLDRQATVVMRALGVTDSFVSHYVRTIELEYVLAVQRIHASSAAQFTNAVLKTDPKVSVNPRYGKWQQKAMSIDGSDSAGLPSFLTLQSAPASGG